MMLQADWRRISLVDSKRQAVIFSVKRVLQKSFPLFRLDLMWCQPSSFRSLRVEAVLDKYLSRGAENPVSRVFQDFGFVRDVI